MIDPASLDDLARAIVHSVLWDADTETSDLDPDSVRRNLVEFAQLHALDTEQTATLFRLAAGEAAHSPAYTIHYRPTQETPT